ncbi:hypothetical protein VTN96DRAFT_9218 [Rasamsonia emersonii]
MEESLILNFLESEAKVSVCVQAGIALKNDLFYDYLEQTKMTGIHLAAYFGLDNIIRELIKKGYSPDLEDILGQTPLSLAAKNGHEAVVKLLLATDSVKSDPDSKDNNGRTPLSYAAEYGHKAVVNLLLATDGVNPESTDDYYRTPLSWAKLFRHEAVVELLLANSGGEV